MMTSRNIIVAVSAALSIIASPVGLAEEPAPALGQQAMIQMTLQNYFSIRIEELDVNRAEAEVRGAKGAYDPRLTASGNVGESGALRSLTGEEESFSSLSIGVEGALPSGTQYALDASSEDFAVIEDGGSRERVSSSELRFTITQPLLRDWGGAETRSRIRIARKDYDISKQAFAQLVMNAVTESQFAYLNAYTAEQSLLVLEESRDRAKQLVGDNRKRIEIGTMAPSDLYQAEAELAARQSQVFAAELRLGNARNAVRRFISGGAGSVLKTEFVLEAPSEAQGMLVDAESDMGTALALRPDYLQAQAALDRSRLNLKLRSSESKAQVDLVGGISYAKTEDNFTKSWKSVARNDDTRLFLGLDFEWPVPNRVAAASRVRAEFARKQAELSVEDLEQLIYVQLDNAARRIQSDWKRLQSAREGLSLAESSLKAEQRKLQSGNSSTFIVLRLQSDLAQARIRELNAVNDYRKAALDYERQLGVTLRKNDIVVPSY